MATAGTVTRTGRRKRGKRTAFKGALVVVAFTRIGDGGKAVIAPRRQKSDGSLDCQHAFGKAANLVADVTVCLSDDSVVDEAEIVLTRIFTAAEDLATDQSRAAVRLCA